MSEFEYKSFTTDSGEPCVSIERDDYLHHMVMVRSLESKEWFVTFSLRGIHQNTTLVCSTTLPVKESIEETLKDVGSVMTKVVAHVTHVLDASMSDYHAGLQKFIERG